MAAAGPVHSHGSGAPHSGAGVWAAPLAPAPPLGPLQPCPGVALGPGLSACPEQPRHAGLSLLAVQPE